MDRRVAPNFWLSEFTVSAMAERHGRTIEIPPHLVPNVERLATTILQPLRDRVRLPIVIISGYRPVWLNNLVGGSRTSAHKQALAADLVVPGLTPLQVIEYVRQLDLEIDQAIEEFGRWVHLGIAPLGETPRRQFLEATKQGNRTVYRPLMRSTP